MSAALAIAFAAGGLLKAHADRKEAQAQAEAARAKAAAKRAQAAEMLIRSEENIFASLLEGEQFKGEQTAAFAKSGVAIGEGSTLSALEETATMIERNVSIQRREAQYKADALYLGADLDTKLSGDIMKANKYQTISTVFSAGTSAAQASGK